jgi:hypothetical protein
MAKESIFGLKERCMKVSGGITINTEAECGSARQETPMSASGSKAKQQASAYIQKAKQVDMKEISPASSKTAKERRNSSLAISIKATTSMESFTVLENTIGRMAAFTKAISKKV